MQLRRISEARVNQDSGPVGCPSSKCGAADALVLFQPSKQIGRYDGDVLCFDGCRFSRIGFDFREDRMLHKAVPDGDDDCKTEKRRDFHWKPFFDACKAIVRTAV
jgi:hypothetical protein